MTWEYIKGSEADFEGYGDEWVSVWIDVLSPNKPFAAKDGVTFSDEQRFELIARRRKVGSLYAAPFSEFDDLFDTVQRPAHYNQSDIECIDAIKASMTLAEFQSYLKGNVLKYLWRYRHKNGLEDVKKAQWYLNRLAQELESES